MNFYEFNSIGAQYIALYMNDNKIIYFDSFGIK